MPKGRVERLIPKRFQTIGNMLKEGVKVRAHCSKCDLTLVVDLELLKSHHGESFSLIGKRGKCRRLNCDGSTVFLVEGHERYGPLKLSAGLIQIKFGERCQWYQDLT